MTTLGPHNRLVLLFMLASLVACAPPSSTPSSTVSAAVSPVAPTATRPVKPGGKLTPRLQRLASDSALRAASADEQARVLSLPAQGPGSLVRDTQGRILVTVRTSDTSISVQQVLQRLGADVASVSERYQQLTVFAPLQALSAIADLPAVLSVQEELSPGAGDGSAGGVVPPPKSTAYP